MRFRMSAAYLAVAVTAAAICGTSCAASAAVPPKNKKEDSSFGTQPATSSDVAASHLRGADADNDGGSNLPLSSSLPFVSVRGERDNFDRNSRQLGLNGGYASVIQGLLSVLETTDANTGNGCSPTSPCRLCEGDCDTDDDCGGASSNMRCYQREYPYTAVPGCQGAEKREDTSDFCYFPPDDAGPELRESDCENMGRGACGMCEGDCDSDRDCAGNMLCFQRHYELTAVPGCYGGDLLWNREDFCHLPPPKAKNEIDFPDDGCSSSRPCAKCRGECNADFDCAGDLKCWSRDMPYHYVPGCLGGDFLEDTFNVCYDPSDDDRVRYGGSGDDCTPDVPCSKCGGDCDADDDCDGDLICFQREISYTEVPGCSGGHDDKSTVDYCADPVDVDATVTAPSVSGRFADADDWEGFVNYNYDMSDTDRGPIGWGDLNAANNEWQEYDAPSTSTNMCDGDAQSPIDLTFANAICEETHHIYTFPGDIDFYNGAGAIEFAIDPFRLRINFKEHIGEMALPGIDPPGGIAGGVTQKDASHAELMIPSEHAIGGKKFEGEYRIYHAEDGFDTIIAVALMLSTDADWHNPWMEVLLRKWEKVTECGNGNGYIDREMGYKEIYNMIRSMYFWAYEGSLTTPPCSEIVQWRIIDTPVQMSKDQFERFRFLLREGGPCANHLNRRSLGKYGATRPLQRDSSNSKVWRCTVDDYMWRK